MGLRPEDTPANLPERQETFDLSPLPSSSSFATLDNPVPLLPIVSDGRALIRLMALLIRKSGRSQQEIATLMGDWQPNISNTLAGKRVRPSLVWFLRFVEACGGKVRISFK